MADTAHGKTQFEFARAQQKASLERAWSQIPPAELIMKLAELSWVISEGARSHRDGTEDKGHLGYLVQMAGVANFLRQTGIHSESDLKPIDDNHREQQALGLALSKFRHDLAEAAALHRNQHCQRVGVMSALKGAVDLSLALHASFEPLRHIFDELQDLEEGKKPGKLTRADRKNKNAEAGSAEWGLRAALWAAMEVRIRMGEDVSTAITRISRDCSEAVDWLRGKHSNKHGRQSTQHEKLKELRRTIGQGRYPKNVNARVIIGTVKECLPPDGAKPCETHYQRMVQEVNRYLNRLL